MIVSFATEELAALCNSERALVRRFDPKRGRLICQRLYEIAGSPSVDHLRMLPALSCTHRKVGRHAQVMVRVDQRTILVIEELPRVAGRRQVVIVELIDETEAK